MVNQALQAELEDQGSKYATINAIIVVLYWSQLQCLQ